VKVVLRFQEGTRNGLGERVCFDSRRIRGEGRTGWERGCESLTEVEERQRCACAEGNSGGER
jgi:hypothetical protein